MPVIVMVVVSNVHPDLHVSGSCSVQWSEREWPKASSIQGHTRVRSELGGCEIRMVHLQ